MSIALAMIVRDEEEHLDTCLRSVRGLFDDVVIVDTGSKDATVTIARRHGARVYRFAWCDDFAAARNHGLARVRTRWVMRMDADDCLPTPHRLRFTRLLRTLDDRPAGVYMMRVDSPDASGRVSYLDEHRIWPTHNNLLFHGRVHERIRPEVDAPHLATYMTEVSLRHVGYADGPATRAKLERNLRLLEMAKGDEPDPFTLFDAGRTYGGLGMHDECIAVLRRFLEVRDPGYVLASKIAYRRICESLRAIGRIKESVLVAQDALGRYPDDCMLCAWVADTMLLAGEPGLAREGYALALGLYDRKVADSGVPTDFAALMRSQIARLDACVTTCPTTGPTQS